jgi:low temperature requirement protein LtrA
MVSPEDQGATFVELFFDLVFVFAITQVTHYAAHHLDAHGIFRAVVVFWLIWWGWTQFTWALNSANTQHHHVRVGTLVSTGVAFVMAVSLDDAFSDTTGALWFALSYVGVRTLGLGLYYQVLTDGAQRSSVRAFAMLSIGGLVAVLVGSLVDPSLRDWIWLAAIAMDFGAAWLAGNKWSWGVHAGHFAERHGLIIIIALGESLIVAGGALVSGVTLPVLVTGSIAVVLTCLLWWTYFGWVQGVLEESLIAIEGPARSQLARDAYSFGHFPLVSGIIALAVGFEASFHPEAYGLVQIAAAVGVGLTLFLVSTAASLWRALRCVLWNRLMVLALTLGALAFSAGSSVNVILGVAAAGLAVIVVIEQLTVRRRLASH